MAVRALIPAERLNIAHVNSVDGSTDYESGTEYKAGTVVTYNGNTYVANLDIEDTDTDTPDAAPDKWGICPNARSLVEGGEMADLETRVSALENTVGDETSGLVKDVDDLQDAVSGKLVQVGFGHTETYTPAESESWAVKIGKLRTQMLSIIAGIEDDERIRITEIILGSTVVTRNKAFHLISNGGGIEDDFSNIESNSSGYTVIRTVKVASVDTDNRYIFAQINNSTAVLTVEDRSSTSNTTSVGFRYEIYKLLS